MDGRGLKDRRQFTVEMALALLGGAAVTIGCGGGGGGSPAGPTQFVPPRSSPPSPSPDRFAIISGNHGHEAVITAAQLLAGGALRLDIMGGASHNHTVQLTAEEVVSIREGARVEKSSSEDEGLLGLHLHPVRFN